MREQNAVSQTEDRIPSEEAGAQAVSFVVRIWIPEEKADAECRGWVEHVQSGERTFFLGLDHLSSTIAAHIGLRSRRGAWWRNGLKRWHARFAGIFCAEKR